MIAPSIDKSLLVPGTKLDRLPNHPDIPNPIPLRFGIAYGFSKPGVTLEEHTHPEGKGHYTIVTKGVFALHRDGKVCLLYPGDIAECAAGVAHSIVCIETGTIVNGTLPP